MPINKRHTTEEYLCYGFTTILDKGKVMPQCVLCGRVFSAFSLKPSKMIRHMECRHPESRNKPLAFFREQCERIKSQGVLSFRPGYNVPAETVAEASSRLASMKAAWRIAKGKCKHYVGEEVLLPAAFDVSTVLFGSETANRLKQLQLSELAVRQNIRHLSMDVKEQTVDALKRGVFFALLLDETTDLENGEHLLVYVRYLAEQLVEEDFLICEMLPSEATSEEVFEKVDDFLLAEGLTWINCVAMCTSGSPTFVGFKEIAKSRNPDILVLHSFLMRQNLFLCNSGGYVAEVFEEVLFIINFIKSLGRQSNIYSKLSSILNDSEKKLLANSSTRWILDGRVFSKLIWHKDEVAKFLKDNRCELSTKPTDAKWLATVCYIRDILMYFNRLSKAKTQESVENIIEISVNVDELQERLQNWSKESEIFNDPVYFPSLSQYLFEIEEDSVDSIIGDLHEAACQHWTHLSNYLDEFKIDMKSSDWIRSPLSIDLKNLPETSIGLKLDLLDMVSNQSQLIEEELGRYSLVEFWIRKLSIYPKAGSEALRILLAFPTSEMCETGFNTIVQLRMDEKTKFDIEHDVRLNLTSRTPRFESILGKLMPSYDLATAQLNGVNILKRDETNDLGNPHVKLLKKDELESLSQSLSMDKLDAADNGTDSVMNLTKDSTPETKTNPNSPSEFQVTKYQTANPSDNEHVINHDIIKTSQENTFINPANLINLVTMTTNPNKPPSAIPINLNFGVTLPTLTSMNGTLPTNVMSINNMLSATSRMNPMPMDIFGAIAQNSIINPGLQASNCFPSNTPTAIP